MKKNSQSNRSGTRPGDFPDWAPPVLVRLFREKFEGKSFARRKPPTADDLSVMKVLLHRLITDPKMEPVWASLTRRQWRDDDPDTLARNLFAVVYSGLMAPRHPWTGATVSKRTKKVTKIRRLVGQLRIELANTPLAPLSKAAVRRLEFSPGTGVDQRDPRFMDFYLSQLDRRAEALTRVKTTAVKTQKRQVARRLLLLELRRYLAFFYGDGALEDMAVIAQVALDDPDIDKEVVRRILDRR